MTTTKAKQGLNPKHELFVLEFLKDLNATRAYKEAYKCKDAVADANWCRLLGNARIKEEVDKKLRERFTKADKDWQRVIDRLFELVDRCMQKEPVMIRQWKTFVQKKDYWIDPNTGEEYEVGVWKFDSAGANGALANLGKYFKLFVDRHQIEWDLNIIVKKVE